MRERTYRGERTVGGQLVYGPDGDLLDQHTDVLQVASGGFDWGPDADPEKFQQLAIALMAEATTGVPKAVVTHYHTFAHSLHEQIGDVDGGWELDKSELRGLEWRSLDDDEVAFENQRPTVEDLPPLTEVDLKECSFAEIVAYHEHYEDQLYSLGFNEYRAEIERYQAILTGDNEPLDEDFDRDILKEVSGQSLWPRELREEFDTVREFAALLQVPRYLKEIDGVGTDTYVDLVDIQEDVERYVGGREQLPDPAEYIHEDQGTLSDVGEMDGELDDRALADGGTAGFEWCEPEPVDE